MRKLTSSIAVLFLVACTHKPIPVKKEEASLPPVSPHPVEEVVVEKMGDELKEERVRNPRERARKLLEIILGGVNR